MKALEARLAYETTNLDSLRRLYQKRALASDELQRKMHEVEQMSRQRDALQKHYEAVRRGPLPEEIEVARGQLAVAEARLQRARVEHDFHLIRATQLGDHPRNLSPCRRFRGHRVPDADPADRRHEPPANPARSERAGRPSPRGRPARARFRSEGETEVAGQLVVKTIVPMFGPRRLFNPDTSVRNDTRTVAVLCEPADLQIPLLLGQRVTAFLVDTSPKTHVRVAGACSLAASDTLANSQAMSGPPMLGGTLAIQNGIWSRRT